jgi:integrase
MPNGRIRRSPDISPGSVGTCGSSSGVEHHVANVGVEGSNPFSRSETEALKTKGLRTRQDAEKSHENLTAKTVKNRYNAELRDCIRRFLMARHKADIPSYRRHRASGQAVVTLNGVDHYLGPWNTEASRAEYDRVTSEWLVRGRRLSSHHGADPLMKELILGFYGHCVATMRDVEIEKVKLAMKPVRSLYGETKVSEFKAVAYRAVRSHLIKSGLAISTIRDRMGIVRRMIAWGVEHEMAPAESLQRIEAVGGLRAGRDGVKPSRKIRPAPPEHIQAILPHLNATVRAMVEIQALTGMRPGEIWVMTTGQIDRTPDVYGNWWYSPTKHKTVDMGRDRKIPLGPKAQAVLKPWLRADPDAILFSPIEASARHYEEQRQSRKTPLYPSSRKRRGKKRGPKRVPKQTYNKNSYALAIERGCVRAGVPVFRPNQIRHTLGTKVRREFSLEHAQVVLGHAKADVSQRYAERDMALAGEVAAKIG